MRAEGLLNLIATLKVICLNSSQLHFWSGSSKQPVKEFILVTLQSWRKLSHLKKYFPKIFKEANSRTFFGFSN